MDIVIVHIKRLGLVAHPLFKVDRSTPLGNPASHLTVSKAEVKTNTVDEAVDYFDQQFKTMYRNNPAAKVLLNKIYQAAIRYETIYLGCWCMDELDPKPSDHNCHCTVIRRVLKKRWERENT